MKFHTFVSKLLIASCVLASGLCVAQQERPESTIEGLQLAEDSNLALVYTNRVLCGANTTKSIWTTPISLLKRTGKKSRTGITPAKLAPMI